MAGRRAVEVFLQETADDLTSPVTSAFGKRVALFRDDAQRQAERLDIDADGLKDLKRSVKQLEGAGMDVYKSELDMVLALDRLAQQKVGESLADEDDTSSADIGSALSSFSVMFKQLATNWRGLMQTVNNSLVFPLDSLLKSDLKDKQDCQRNLDKAIKDFETRYQRLERELKQQNKESGYTRSTISPANFAEELNLERSNLQMELVKFYLMVSRVDDRKSAGLLQNLVDYYHSQEAYFRDGLGVMEDCRANVDRLVERLGQIKTRQEAERCRLHQLHDRLNALPILRPAVAHPEPSVATVPLTLPIVDSSSSSSLAAPKSSLDGWTGDAAADMCGYLCKRSANKLHNQWQRRRCVARDGRFFIHHSDESRAPVEISLLTSDIKEVADEPRSFDLYCNRRTYRLQAESETAAKRWLAVLRRPHFPSEPSMHASEPNAVVEAVRARPGNRQCADCAAVEAVSWVSTNLGGVYCINCSGVHRQLGVHHSRIKSIVLDEMKNVELLIPLIVGNDLLNQVYEQQRGSKARLSAFAQGSDRKAHIYAKYVDKRYVDVPANLVEQFVSAVQQVNVAAILRCVVAGVDVNHPVDEVSGDSAVMHLLALDDCRALPLIELLIQNGANVNWRNLRNESVLDKCMQHGRGDAMKLFLRSRQLRISSSNIRRDLDDADECCQLLSQARLGNRDSLDAVTVSPELLNRVSANVPSSSAGHDGCSLALLAETPPPPPRPPSHQPITTGVAPLPPSSPLSTAAPRLDESLCSDASISFTSSDLDGSLVRSPRAPPLPPRPPPPTAKPKLSQRSASELGADHRATHDLVDPAFPPRPPPPFVRSKTLPRPPPRPHAPAAVGPVPAPRLNKTKPVKRCRALFDCEADERDELTFGEGDEIVVTNETVAGEDASWMEGYVDGRPDRKGIFPVTFVTFDLTPR